VDFDLEQQLPGCALTFVQIRRRLQVDFTSMYLFAEAVQVERSRMVPFLVASLASSVCGLSSGQLACGNLLPYRIIDSPDPEKLPLHEGQLLF
jgi:hypothetical protein